MARPRVALLIESSRRFGRDLLLGIGDYAERYGPWTFYHEARALGDPPPHRLRDWKPDGILARIEDRGQLRALLRLGVPLVDLIFMRRPPLSGTVRVVPDQEAVAVLAAEHLRSLGLREFAFCGYAGIDYSEARRVAFASHLEAAGFRVNVHQQPRLRPVSETRNEREAMHQIGTLREWLQSLPKPVGIMACNDVRAKQILELCAEIGVPVPDDVALVGVDDDEVVCRFCNPSLSSVDPNVRQVGCEAAAILGRMMRGEPASTDTVLLPPSGVIRRRSTDILAVADPDLRQIIRQIRETACEGLTVEQLAAHFAMSLSTLKRLFAKHLGRTPSDEIDRVKLDHVRRLLATTDLTLAEISGLAGFAHVETMHRVFKTACGRTPARYRAETRAGHLPPC